VHVAESIRVQKLRESVDKCLHEIGSLNAGETASFVGIDEEVIGLPAADGDLDLFIGNRDGDTDLTRSKRPGVALGARDRE
jgi:hypothetical protein